MFLILGKDMTFLHFTLAQFTESYFREDAWKCCENNGTNWTLGGIHTLVATLVREGLADIAVSNTEFSWYHRKGFLNISFLHVSFRAR